MVRHIIIAAWRNMAANRLISTIASLGALLIALVMVAGQAFLTARAKPVLALRYE